MKRASFLKALAAPIIGAKLVKNEEKPPRNGAIDVKHGSKEYWQNMKDGLPQRGIWIPFDEA